MSGLRSRRGEVWTATTVVIAVVIYNCRRRRRRRSKKARKRRRTAFAPIYEIEKPNPVLYIFASDSSLDWLMTAFGRRKPLLYVGCNDRMAD